MLTNNNKTPKLNIPYSLFEKLISIWKNRNKSFDDGWKILGETFCSLFPTPSDACLPKRLSVIRFSFKFSFLFSLFAEKKKKKNCPKLWIVWRIQSETLFHLVCKNEALKAKIFLCILLCTARKVFIFAQARTSFWIVFISFVFFCSFFSRICVCEPTNKRRREHTNTHSPKKNYDCQKHVYIVRNPLFDMHNNRNTTRNIPHTRVCVCGVGLLRSFVENIIWWMRPRSTIYRHKNKLHFDFVDGKIMEKKNSKLRSFKEDDNRPTDVRCAYFYACVYNKCIKKRINLTRYNH